MKPFHKILILVLILFSCHKDKSTPGSEVEMYLLQSYQLETGKCMVNPSSAILEGTPIVSNDDILKYSRSSYTYKLSDKAFERIKALNPRTPFAVTVDQKVVFLGIYMPSFMSSSCDHSITMDVLNIENKEVHLRLGYPGLIQGQNIDDQRNNNLIISSLRKQGKLR